MAESIHSQILAALKTRLEGIVGNGGAAYWYTPSAVVRVTVYDRLLADPSVGDVIYALRAGEERHSEQATGDSASGGVVEAQAEVWVLILKRTAAADESPFGADGETKVLEQDRLARDFLRALWLDVTLGGLVQNVVDGSLAVDRDVDVEGWACVEARFTMLYSYLARTP